MVLNIRIWAFQEQVPFKLSFSIQKWLTIIFHLWMTLGTAPARMYAKNENKVHYLWPLWASLACVRKVKLLGNTSPPPGFLTSLKVVLIFVNNLWLMRLISCQQTKSFYNAHSFRVCISWRFEGFLPLFRVVPFPFIWHGRTAGYGCEQGTICHVQSQGLLPGCAAGSLPFWEWIAQLLPVSAFKLGAVTLFLDQLGDCAFPNACGDMFSDCLSVGVIVMVVKWPVQISCLPLKPAWSWLCDRTQRMVANGSMSEWRCVTWMWNNGEVVSLEVRTGTRAL